MPAPDVLQCVWYPCMSLPSLPTSVRILVNVAKSGLDWFSNPWKGGPQFMAEWTAPYELRKLQVSWSRTPTVGVVQDNDICTFHFLNLTGGDPDASWITADYTTVENAFDALWTAILDHYPPETKLVEYLWRADGPAFRPHGSALSPTLRATPRAVVGAGVAGSVMPPQCAMSVTEVTEAKYTAFGVGVPGSVEGTGRTQARNRWGRFYLPALTIAAITDGRFNAATCTQVGNAVQTFYNACAAADLVPVMYSPTTGNAWSILEVHVDDIVDVQRSRRYITPTTRTVKTINAAA